MQTTSYKLNVTPGGVPLTIHISQYDVGLRQYTFQPYTTVGEFSYVSGATVTLEATKPDGYAVIHECDYNQDGSITYTVQAQLAAKPGRVWSKVVIRDGSDVLGTGAIIWVVDYAGVKDNAIISDSDISALQQWMDDVEDYAEQADGSAQAAASSASLAESAVTSAQAAATQAAGYVDQAVILGGTPLVAATVSAMSNHDRVYVYTGSETGYTAGNWYYWNGSAWASGGIYNSSAVQTDPTLSVSGMAADAAATGELKDELHGVEDATTTYKQQYIDTAQFEQCYYWYNSSGTINHNYNATGFAYYTYPKLTLHAGTYYINYVPNSFAFLKTVSDGTVVTLKSAVTSGAFTITEDTEFYLTVYDSAGTLLPTVMLADATLPQSYFYGRYNFAFKYVTLDTMDFANGTRKIHTVGVGGDYTTITAACTAADADDIIFILPGTYTEQVSIWGKKLHLIGFDKKLCTIIDHTGNYDTPPIEMNVGTIANLTIIEDGSAPTDENQLAYCIHNDFATGTNGEMLDIVNCDMINDVHSCIGFGMYANYTVRIRNCTMRSNGIKAAAYKRGALYFHANSSSNVTGQTFIVENCIISSADDIAVYAGVPSGGSGEMLVRFLNNAVWSDTNGTFPDAATISENATFVLDSASTGNSITKLNNTVSRQGSRYTLTVNASSSAVVNAKRNRITINGSYHFFVVSEDRTSYDTGVIYWNTDGSLVVEEKNALCNVTFSSSNGDLRVWNRDTANNHSYMVMVSPL